MQTIVHLIICRYDKHLQPQGFAKIINYMLQMTVKVCYFIEYLENGVHKNGESFQVLHKVNRPLTIRQGKKNELFLPGLGCQDIHWCSLKLRDIKLSLLQEIYMTYHAVLMTHIHVIPCRWRTGLYCSLFELNSYRTLLSVRLSITAGAWLYLVNVVASASELLSLN